ncbi:HET-domain-containing protein, partial [Decorospora gaudefroyi]
RFAALTYCWGSTQQSSTTTANVASRFSYLNTFMLPQTLQDALVVARGLGLEYIWIDSLCILQDNHEDWASEASKMAAIYSNAHVVLAATFAKDCAEGFLRPDSHACWAPGARTPWAIFTRGWCMQERFLARRILHFFPNEMQFECQSERICERDTVHETFPRPDHHRFGELWGLVIQVYSCLSLTCKEDILPALSGVAHGLAHLFKGKYLAGLWELDIAYQLGW